MSDGTEPGEPRPGRPPSVRDSMGGEDSARPTPVRLSMDTPREEPEPPEPPSSTLIRNDQEWIVRVEGRARTGGARDVGAPLLFLTFARSEEPEKRVYETLRVGVRLEDLGESELREALDRARPYDGEWERSGLFQGTRRKRNRS